MSVDARGRATAGGGMRESCWAIAWLKGQDDVCFLVTAAVDGWCHAPAVEGSFRAGSCQELERGRDRGGRIDPGSRVLRRERNGPSTVDVDQAVGGVVGNDRKAGFGPDRGARRPGRDAGEEDRLAIA